MKKQNSKSKGKQSDAAPSVDRLHSTGDMRVDMGVPGQKGMLVSVFPEWDAVCWIGAPALFTTNDVIMFWDRTTQAKLHSKVMTIRRVDFDEIVGGEPMWYSAILEKRRQIQELVDRSQDDPSVQAWDVFGCPRCPHEVSSKLLFSKV